MSDSEAVIERYFINQCEANGWMCLKLVDRGRRGFPDRTVLKHSGDHFFAELKCEGGKLSALQKMRIRQIRMKGHRVYICWSKVEVDKMMEIESQ